MQKVLKFLKKMALYTLKESLIYLAVTFVVMIGFFFIVSIIAFWQYIR